MLTINDPKHTLSRPIVLLLVASLVLLGCGGGARVHEPPGLTEQEIAEAQELSEFNSKIMSLGSMKPASPSDYFIGPADLLEIKVFEADELSTTVRVSSRGFITLPLLGSVKVTDVTARQAEERIERMLMDGGYLNEPGVSVYISEHRSKQISIVGEVNKPGNYELLGSQSLIDALAMSGGLAAGAGRSAYLTRTNRDGSRQAYLVDLDEILQSGNAELNIDLRPGDVLYVASSGNVFLEGAVRNPGSVPIKTGETTLSQAITAAGGIASYADPGDVRVLRHHGRGKREIIQVDLEAIRSGSAEDPILSDRDAVIVGASGFKKFVYGLGLSLGFGLVGVSYAPPDK